MKFSIFALPLFSLLLFSCGTSKKYVADDIYVLKPSELPIGESSADETSYAAFKKRKDGAVQTDRQVYEDQNFRNNTRNCLSQPFWFSGCGCSYVFWTQNSPYSMQYNSWTYSYHQGFGSMYGYGPYNSLYYTTYYNPDFGVYFGSPYYNPYNGTYYNPYNYGYGLSGYGGYGYAGNGYYSTNSSSHGINHHNGPRGSASGYSNPNGRPTTSGPVKSGLVNTPMSSKNTSAKSASSMPVRKSISTINTTPVSRPTHTGNVTRNPGSNSRSTPTTQGHTYKKQSSAPTRTYTPPATRNSNPVQRQNSGGTVIRSGNSGSSNSNGGTTRSSSGSSSTPRSNTNTGRRP